LKNNFGAPHVSEVWRCSNKAASSRHCEEYTLAMYLFKNGNNPNPTKRLITNFGTPHVSEVWRHPKWGSDKLPSRRVHPRHMFIFKSQIDYKIHRLHKSSFGALHMGEAQRHLKQSNRGLPLW